MSTIFHICGQAEWAGGADPLRPASLATEGFVHCSDREQVVGTAGRHFRGRRDLVLLEVDPTRAKAELKIENGYPHLYGPLPRAAVLRWAPFGADAEGRFGFPAPADWRNLT